MLAVILITCKKDPQIPSEFNTDCIDFTWSTLSGVIAVGDTNYYYPRFNPKNSNEIIYVQGNKTDNKSYIVKYNILANQETYIIDNILRRPDWSSKDWIVFNHGDNQVWKIKSNGDSLTLLTPDLKGGHNAVWNQDGNKIAYVYEGGPSDYTLICDETGKHLDSLPYFSFYLNQWSSDGGNICGLSNDYANVLYQNVYTHAVYHPTNNVLDEHSTNMIYLDGIAWTPDSKFLIWANPHGIYKTNINTWETKKIKTACASKYYSGISISPDGQKIIAQRGDQKLENNYLYIKTGLSLIDIDGQNEVILK
jgi:tricorn protease-like protein